VRARFSEEPDASLQRPRHDAYTIARLKAITSREFDQSAPLARSNLRDHFQGWTRLRSSPMAAEAFYFNDPPAALRSRHCHVLPPTRR